ncbi:zinc finger BED domain-containing protein RICESLEEPER 2-like [Brassica napus]|uniref:zinc finger BED domain-containing protein RICESLEEPER 2-like n=1 Tax=Brassica napus TaxID=3708 RepID=UPI002078515B|nr:zinc finger BED domain-containing protein RICESLEEPER 2-like [Brassica napus]
MDYDTVHTMALLEAQREYMDMNDEDVEFDIDEEMAETETEAEAEVQCEPQATASTQAAKPQRKRRKTSLVWKDFVLVGVEEDGKERAKCIHCDSKLVVGKTHGTNQLKRHLEFCSKMPKKVDKHVYDHMVDREMVTESIIYHDLPFRYVEYEKVRERDRYLNPDVQHICRQTAALDVYRRYEIEKEKLKGLFVKHRGRVCLTADLWVARPQNMGYICLTGHYIDDGWRLHSKILEFCEMKSPHTGEEIANKVFESLKGWGLEKKVFSMTLDNATNNNSMLRILKGKLQMIGGSDGGLLSDGKHIHVRCCAHILNLIVKSGLALANSLLHNIRESVRYVKASPQRQEAFAACVERVRITSGLGLSLDVPTRWNSTYEMLFRALKFKAAFASMELYDPKYKTLPTEDEWKRGAKICDLLKPFSAITTSFSGSKYPTSNVYFTQVWRIQLLLKRYAECDDDGVREMAREMQVKFDKYWKSYSVILAMGAALDPRIKIEMLEAAYKKLDPSTSSLKIKELKDSLSALYKDYQKRSQTSSSGVSLTPTPQEIVTESPLED